MNINRRIFKTVLAAGLAWFLADELIGSPYPYFAPMAAVVVLQVTVARSLWRSVERVVGVIVGVVLALALTRLVEVNVWTLSVLILAALLAARMLGFRESSAHQLATSAILVAYLGPTTHGYARAQIEQTIIGAAVAVIINAVISPYDHLSSVRCALEKLGHDLARTAADLAEEVRAPRNPPLAHSLRERERTAFADLHALRAALELAEESLRLNYFGARQRARLSLYQAIADALENVVVEMRGLSRMLCETGQSVEDRSKNEIARCLNPRTAAALSELLVACASALERFSESNARQSVESQQLPEHVAEVERKRCALLNALNSEPTIAHPECWVWLGGVVTDVTRIVGEITARAELWQTHTNGSSNLP